MRPPKADRAVATDAAPVAMRQEPALMQAVTDATRAMQAAAAQLTRLGQALAQPGSEAAADGPMVDVWGDDPRSEPGAAAGRRPVMVRLQGIANPLLRVAIAEAQPAIGRHAPGTSEFRYWNAAEALSRGIAFWSGMLPAGTTWSAANPLPVRLVAPDDLLNAFYARADGLTFFRGMTGMGEVFTGESADVVLHELGHAVLDALRPQLFNAGLTEAAAFHEAFGDVNAILCGLQLAWMRDAVMAETGGRIRVSSCLSRIAESLAWGIRQTQPQSVDADCLRNAANSFAYRRPDLLPTSAGAGALSRAPHSFSRVFTGAFFDALSGMFAAGATRDADHLRMVSEEAARLLVAAIRTAPITTSYFSQLAAAMIQADEALHGGRYRTVLSQAFMRREILSVPSALGLVGAVVPALPVARGMAIASPPDVGALRYADEEPDTAHLLGYGETPDLPPQPVVLDGLRISVHLPDEPPRFAVAPATRGPEAEPVLSNEVAGRLFLEELIGQGRVELMSSEAVGLRGVMPQASGAPPPRVTHRLVEEGGAMVLRRVRFQCCPDADHPAPRHWAAHGVS